MGQQAIQVSLTAVWTLFAGPIAEHITAPGWYGLGAGLAGIQLILAFFFLPETKYPRSAESFQDAPVTQETESLDDVESSSQKESVPAVQLCTVRPPLDTINYPPRTWRSDMRIIVGPVEWLKVWDVLRVSPFGAVAQFPLLLGDSEWPVGRWISPNTSVANLCFDI